MTILEFIKNHPIICAGWVACFVGIFVTLIQDKLLGVKEIGNSLVTVILNKENGVIIDLRTLDEFRKGHIQGSMHVLQTDIENNNLGKLSNHKEKPIILANFNGTSLIPAAKQLKKLGFQNIYILKDGISGWLTDNLPLVRK